MSALDRYVTRRCPDCKQIVIYGYDADGASVKYDQVVPQHQRHLCETAASRHVGSKPLETK